MTSDIKTFQKPDEISFSDSSKTTANVIDSFHSLYCPCGQHAGTVYILDENFVVMNCSTENKLLWRLKPKDIDGFKYAMTNVHGIKNNHNDQNQNNNDHDHIQE